MLLRDEQDIIVQNLTHLLTWIDALYILDLGSTDGTWDVVQDFASRDKRIVPFKSSPIIYNDNLRCVIGARQATRCMPGNHGRAGDGPLGCRSCGKGVVTVEDYS